MTFPDCYGVNWLYFFRCNKTILKPSKKSVSVEESVKQKVIDEWEFTFPIPFMDKQKIWTEQGYKSNSLFFFLL